MRSFSTSLLVGAAAAATLRLNPNGAVSASLHDLLGSLTLTSTNCVDRSNWCPPFQDTRCQKSVGATVLKKAEFSSTGAAIALYTDGVLRFDSPTCVRIDLSVPPAKSDTPAHHGQMHFGLTSRVFIDASDNMVIQSATIVDNSVESQRPGVVVQPTSYPTPYPTPYPTAYPTPNPTPYPTPNPTPYPTPNPTPYPTPNPTPYPTPYPTPIQEHPSYDRRRRTTYDRRRRTFFNDRRRRTFYDRRRRRTFYNHRRRRTFFNARRRRTFFNARRRRTFFNARRRRTFYNARRRFFNSFSNSRRRFCVSKKMRLVKENGATITVGAASATKTTVMGRASLTGPDKQCSVKKFFPHLQNKMQKVNAEHTTQGHDLWTTAGKKFYDDKLVEGGAREEVGQIFTSCPYVILKKADGSRDLTSVLTTDCELSSTTFEAIWEPVMLVHMNYLMGDTEMIEVSNPALHGLCGYANLAFAQAGAVNRDFYIAMWPHFECWASAMQWQKAGANGYWHKHLTAIAKEFNIEKEVPTASSLCSGDPKDYMANVDAHQSSLDGLKPFGAPK